MKAIILKEFGGVENLVEADIPKPAISEDEVLVKAKAISINPVDIKTRSGKALALRLRAQHPMVLGWDISGIITDTGKSVRSFKKGDEVFGMINFPGIGSAYAEYIAAPEAHLALKPANISHEEAAAASLSALTAWQILKDTAHIKKGDRVLIHAAAGGVGHFAVQMAKHLGADVSGTSSASNRDFILQLGASQHIDYEKQNFEDSVSNMDFVLDAIGGNYIDKSLNVLKPGGTIISIPSDASENVAEKANEKGMTGIRFMVSSNGQKMQEIADLLFQGKIKSHISTYYHLNEIRDAHMQIETKKTRGKIIVTL